MKRLSSVARPRRGFTLIELLVVISIIAVLMSLILPAIQQAREAGRRTQCLNHIRNVALALHNHASSRKGHLPNAGTWMVDPNDPGNNALYVEGASWVVDLLAYLDQQGIADRWNRDIAWNSGSNNALQSNYMAVLACPNDESAFSQEGGLSYIINSGYNGHQSGMDYNAAGLDWDGDGVVNTGTTVGVDPDDSQITRQMGLTWNHFIQNPAISGPTFTPRKSQSLSLDRIYDGMSSTILLTENLNAGPWARPGLSSRLWWSVDPANPDLATVPRHPSFDGRINQSKSGPEGSRPYPNSNHPGGVSVATCDGGAKFISEDIDEYVWAQMISPNGTRLRNGLTSQPPLSEDSF